MSQELAAAARNGDLPEVKSMLLDGGASIADRTILGYSLLLIASAQGDLPMVQWLLREGGASITERDDGGCTALLRAAHHTPTTQWLLDHGGAGINETADDGRTSWDLWSRRFRASEVPPPYRSRVFITLIITTIVVSPDAVAHPLLLFLFVFFRNHHPWLRQAVHI
jgi:hypothetical protein